METRHSKTARWQGHLLPHIVDKLAAEEPQGVYSLWPVTPSSYEAGFRETNYAQLANLMNGLAWWIFKQLGPGNGEQVLTYIGPNDVRYCALILAAVKAGYVLFLTSPRNSAAAQQSLFAALKCDVLLTTSPVPPPAKSVIEAVKPRQFIVPDIDDLLRETHDVYAYEKTFEEARDDPLMIMEVHSNHTSGSTGLPKPLVWTQATGAAHLNLSGSPVPDGVSSVDSLLQGKRVMVTLPPFHGAGVAQYLYGAIPFGNISIAPAATGIVTAQGLLEALRQTPADVAFLVPSVVAELAQDPDILEECSKHIKQIVYIGGDLPEAIGNKVATKIDVRCCWGASEVGIPQQLVPPDLGPLDWRYVCFHPRLGAVFEEVTEGSYELVIRRNDTLADTQACFTIRGQQTLQEYRTKDLFSPHPTVRNAWAWRARADDIIVFLNGEKTNPISMEQHVVAENKELDGALVIGSQRLQAALLIEPKGTGSMTTADQARLIERVWPSVEEANRTTPAHARVEKSMILVASPDRPFIRAGKGTIQRGASLTQYADEIEILYSNAEIGAGDTADEVAYPASEKEVAVLIRNTIKSITGWTLENSEGFFDRGLDSLQALQLTRKLMRALNRSDLALSTVYQNPTIEGLTAAILQQQSSEVDERGLMEPLLSTYSTLIRQILVPDKSLGPRDLASVDVLLTGSTGSLGTWLLHSLLKRPNVGHIYCLNRASDGGRAAQMDRFFALLELSEYDKQLKDIQERVTFLQANLSSSHLGLEEKTYEALRSRVGLVIHNAWPVNFNLSLSAFRPHLAGVVNLCKLSAASGARLFFVSSVGVVSGEGVEKAAPETVMLPLDETVPGPNGYGRSKYLAELLCDAAARHLRIPVTVARVGQVAGAVQTHCDKAAVSWNKAEWLPSLVLGSLLHLGCLPSDLGPRFNEIDWIPSDVVGEILVELALLPDNQRVDEEGATVFNVRNPHTTTWDKLLPAIKDTHECYIMAAAYLHPDRIGPASVDDVSPAVWLQRLQESVASRASAETNPAIKLIDFYKESLCTSTNTNTTRSYQPMAIDKAVRASRTLRETPAVDEELMMKWIREWIG
ncbi:acetyl-CoA synthetase-like protein [Xylariaceae sp. FL0594]|nr:acetyl-CoA synthetase-like protein [Xylariaceae sp. FL0594]